MAQSFKKVMCNDIEKETNMHKLLFQALVVFSLGSCTGETTPPVVDIINGAPTTVKPTEPARFIENNNESNTVNPCSDESSVSTQWLTRESGKSCRPAEIPTEDEAIELLNEAGVCVLSIETRIVGACRACDICGNGINYFVEIPKSQNVFAKKIGWSDTDYSPDKSASEQE